MMKALMCFLYELAPPTWLRLVGNLWSPSSLLCIPQLFFTICLAGPLESTVMLACSMLNNYEYIETCKELDVFLPACIAL